jgi:uncharacterized protein YjbI with pentapeptide repeats
MSSSIHVDSQFENGNHAISEGNQSKFDAFPYCDLALAPSENQPQDQSTRFPRWTGFEQKTLFDWLGVIAVPLFIAALTLLAAHNSERNRQLEAEIAKDNQLHAAMTSYLAQMNDLLIKNDLRESKQGDEVRSVARAITLNTLRQMNGERKGELIKFLYESDLIGGQCQVDDKTKQAKSCEPPIFELAGAKLENAIFEGSIILTGVDLAGVRLVAAQLPGIDLSRADIKKANLTGTNLTGAFLRDAEMENAILRDANLSEALLTRANLKGAILQGADLRGADLSEAKLQGANLKGAIYDSKTIFPRDNPNPTGFDPENFGMVRQSVSARK